MFQKKSDRIRYLLKIFLFTFSLGVLYAIFVIQTGISIPCLFHLLTGFKCPGCGVTTLFICLFQGRFKTAFYANPFIFLIFPVILFIVGNKIVQWIKVGFVQETHAERIVIAIVLCFTILWGIVRNL